jgi:hypothetical protein
MMEASTCCYHLLRFVTTIIFTVRKTSNLISLRLYIYYRICFILFLMRMCSTFVFCMTNSPDGEESFSISRSSSATQQIPIILWDSKLLYRIRKSPPLVSILRHMNLVHTPCYLLLIFSSASRSF